MSGETRELFEVLLSLSPWIAFVILLVWAAGRSIAARSDDGAPRDRHGVVVTYPPERREADDNARSSQALEVGAPRNPR